MNLSNLPVTGDYMEKKILLISVALEAEKTAKWEKQLMRRRRREIWRVIFKSLKPSKAI